MSSISPDDIRWNDEARTKILEDSDRVLREAVLDVATTHSAGTWEDAFAELNARLKDQFIDFEPGPDLRQYAEAIVGGDIEGVDGGSGSAAGSTGPDGQAESDGAASTGGEPVPATSAESASAETASAGGSYADRPADQIAADEGAAEPATPETDGSADDTASSDSDSAASSAAGTSGSDDPASGGASDGTEAPNETIDDPSDPTIADEPSA